MRRGLWRRRLWRPAALAATAVVVAALALAPPAARAQEAPRPPCAGAAYPPFADPDRPPHVRAWRGAELPPGWLAPSCGAWPAEPVKLATALSGSLRHDGDVDALLARFGRVSALSGLRYWSVTSKSWRVLIAAAHALTAAEDGRARADFTPAEMRSGAPLFYAQDDTGSSATVVYRMRLVAATPEGFVLAVDNVATVRLAVVPLFRPGTLKSLYVVERRAPGVWGYYSLGLVGDGASIFAEGHPASFANRAAALYRHVAGIPADREPPAAP